MCQSCNPLGRCLEYVQEDLEAMGKELEQWRAVASTPAPTPTPTLAPTLAPTLTLPNEPQL